MVVKQAGRQDLVQWRYLLTASLVQPYCIAYVASGRRKEREDATVTLIAMETGVATAVMIIAMMSTEGRTTTIDNDSAIAETPVYGYLTQPAV
jgi:hypothetical protein